MYKKSYNNRIDNDEQKTVTQLNSIQMKYEFIISKYTLKHVN